MNLLQGHSGYFTKPQLLLDPDLFNGTELLESVRSRILSFYFNHMEERGFHNAEKWTTLWLAGSGISYQWAGDRGNGDLDVLLGLDYDLFLKDNPDYSWMERYEISSSITHMLKTSLWPKTAHVEFTPGTKAYEVTYFMSADTDAFPGSIRNINPYTAYELNTDKWIVKPTEPSEFTGIYPVEYEAQASINRETAEALNTRYQSLKKERANLYPNSPQYHNNNSAISHVVSQVRSMFDSIHLGRRNAFTMGGEGYGDFYNYQWQSAKRDGIINTFNEILNGEE